jgi:hypothetical protein
MVVRKGNKNNEYIDDHHCNVVHIWVDPTHIMPITRNDNDTNINCHHTALDRYTLLLMVLVLMMMLLLLLLSLKLLAVLVVGHSDIDVQYL